jgi:hypothetical protein
MNRISLTQSRTSDCVRWLKGAISFDVMKTQANAIIRSIFQCQVRSNDL